MEPCSAHAACPCVRSMNVEPELEVADPLRAGREALRRGEWEQARAYFEAAHEQGASPEAMEAIAMAAWWLDDGQLTIESRECAYRLYREPGDAAGAARMAIWLGWDYLAFRGEPAVARGLASARPPSARRSRARSGARLAGDPRR